MGELGFNKIFGAILAVVLVILGLKEVQAMVFGGGHHGHYEDMPANEWAKKNFAYTTKIASSGGASAEPEEVYDLGLLLASADASKGASAFKSQCSSCHSIEQGGANGTGPNLYAAMFAPKQNVDGFAYSGALANVGGEWTYEAMDEWLRAPSRYANGTSMGFAGINRDSTRADVIAYLTSYTPDAPAFPAPLPAVTEADLELTEGEAATTDAVVIEGAEGAVEDATEIVTDATEETVAAAEDAIEAAADEGAEALAETTDAAEALVEDAQDATDGE